MAQSQSQGQPMTPLGLSLRETDTAMPAPNWDVEELIDEERQPGQHRTATTRLGGDLTARKQRSLWTDAWRRLRRNKLAVIGLIIVATFSIIAIFASVIAPYGQAEVVDFRLARHHPSSTWPMGLDANGRDIFSRMVYGAQVSLVVGVLSQVIVLLIGIPLGAIAGYFGGLTDNVLMRLVDVIYAIPQLLMVLLFVNWWGPGLAQHLPGDRTGRMGDRSKTRAWSVSLIARTGVRAGSAGRRRQRWLHHPQTHAAE